MQWTDQQLQVFEAIERRESVFVTGSAGTGKTMLVQELIKLLRKIYGKRNVSVTAPTGVVACALGGVRPYTHLLVLALLRLMLRLCCLGFWITVRLLKGGRRLKHW